MKFKTVNTAMRFSIYTLCLVTIFSVAVMMASCTGPTTTTVNAPAPTPLQTATLTLLTAKTDINILFGGLSTACRQGSLPADTCVKVAAIYPKVQAAYNTAEQGLIVAARTNNLNDVDTNIKALQDLINSAAILKNEVTK